MPSSPALNNWSNKSLKQAVVALVSIIAASYIFLSYFLLVLVLFPDWSTRSQFGDAFGALNSLFGILTFTGLIYTIHIQRKTFSAMQEQINQTNAAQQRADTLLHNNTEAAKRIATVLTVNNLIKYYEDEVRKFRGMTLTEADPMLAARDEANRKVSIMKNYLENFYSTLQEP